MPRTFSPLAFRANAFRSRTFARGYWWLEPAALRMFVQRSFAARAFGAHLFRAGSGVAADAIVPLAFTVTPELDLIFTL